MTVFISPSGQRFEVGNVAAFAREHGLDKANLYNLAQGLRQHHKGWRSDCPPVGFTSKPYAIERYLNP